MSDTPSPATRASLSASPNPIRVVGASDLGVTTLSWSAPGVDVVELRVGAPDGDLFTRGGASGSATTGPWVASGMRFFLQDASLGKPSLAASTLASVRVAVARSAVDFGDLRRVQPISRVFGFDRGLPIDRHYIELFLERHRGDIQGRVLEIGDAAYTRKFGGERVTRSDVLQPVAGDPGVTIVGDLPSGEGIPEDAFDAVVLTQTLQLLFDVRAAVRTLHRMLRPGGVVLATVPAISQTTDEQWGRTWCWSFTPYSAARLFGERFPGERVEVESFGNVLAAVSLLHGLAAEELRPEELAHADRDYVVLIGVRAVKEAP